MAMMISAKRVRKLLAPQGFQLVDYDPWVRSILFTRPDNIPELYQRVRVDCAGKRGEAASANAQVSLVRIAEAGMGIFESVPLPQLGDVKEKVDEYGFWVPGYGRATIETTERAKEWERQFAEVAPQQAAILAREKGPELLAKTAACRAAANEIQDRLGDFYDLLATCTRLERETSAEQRRQARRLAEWPGVLKISGADMIYEIATTTIVMYSSDVSSLHVNIAADPLHDRELMWLIQILVDRIIIETGWTPNGLLT